MSDMTIGEAVVEMEKVARTFSAFEKVKDILLVIARYDQLRAEGEAKLTATREAINNAENDLALARNKIDEAGHHAAKRTADAEEKVRQAEQKAAEMLAEADRKIKEALEAARQQFDEHNAKLSAVKNAADEHETRVRNAQARLDSINQEIANLRAKL